MQGAVILARARVHTQRAKPKLERANARPIKSRSATALFSRLTFTYSSLESRGLTSSLSFARSRRLMSLQDEHGRPVTHGRRRRLSCARTLSKSPRAPCSFPRKRARDVHVIRNVNAPINPRPRESAVVSRFRQPVISRRSRFNYSSELFSFPSTFRLCQR